MRRRRAVPAALAVAAGAALLGGCGWLAPAYRTPRPDIPPAYDAPSGGPRAASLGWRTVLPDPRLQALVDLALERNRDLRVATLRIAEARAQYRIERADRLPTIDARGTATRVGGTGAGGAATAGGTGGTGIPTTGTANPDARYSIYQANVGVSAFELDFWGRVRNLSEAARQSYLATEQARRAFRIGLIADVADAYLSGRELDERIALAERTVRTRSEALDIAKLRLDAGVTSALDYRQTETLLTQAQTELASLSLARAQNAHALALLLGGPEPAGLPPPRALADQAIVEDVAPGLPSELLAARPDVLEAEAALRAAGANVGAARAAFLPRISLTGLYGYASTAFAALFDADGRTWSYGPTLTVPLFAAGRNRATLDLAVVRRDLAVAGYERTVQNAFREVADALSARRYLADQFEAEQRALAAQSDRAELAQLRYSNGVANYLEVLDAERERFAAEQTVVVTRRQQLSNAVALYVALGGALAD